MTHSITTRATFALGIVLALVAGPVPAFAQSRASASTPRLIVVSNERSHDLTVLNGATLETIATIPLPGRARGVRISPDGRHAYVALSDDRPQTPGPNDAIAEVDLTTHRLLRRLSAGTDPEQFAITPDGRRMVASNEDAGNASIIDPATGKVLASLVVGTEPEGVTVSPDGRWVYVTAETSNTISVIDMRTEKVVATFLVDARPRAVAFSPDGRFAYTANGLSDDMSVVDTHAMRVTQTVKVGTRPWGVAVVR
jgi:YVTN family beta-propeller protein